MGSASREALAQASQALTARLAASAGSELLRVAGELSDNAPLASALSDTGAAPEAKSALLDRLFGGITAGAKSVLAAAISGQWSNVDEFVAGVEELGLRAEAGVNADLVDELLAVADQIDRNHEVQLSLGSKLASAASKQALVDALFSGKISASAISIVNHLVAHARGRRLEAALRQAARIAADQGGSELATVTVASSLSADQEQRLAAALAKTAGRPVKITTVVDAALVGGVRVQIADDVIDGSVRARLDDLRSQLAA